MYQWSQKPESLSKTNAWTASSSQFAPDAIQQQQIPLRVEIEKGRKAPSMDLSRVTEKTPEKTPIWGLSLSEEDGSNTQALQRKVTGFNSTNTAEYGPCQELYLAMQAKQNWLDYPASPGKNIKQALSSQFTDAYSKQVPRTTRVTATAIDNTQPNGKPARDSDKTGRLGHFARDFLFLNRGVSEKFEGGHLIGHSVWDTGDTNVGQANDGHNVVGMTRTMNTDLYNQIEYVLTGAEDVTNAQVDVTYGSDMTYDLKQIADCYGMPIKAGKDAQLKAQTVTVKNWVPTNVALTSATRSVQGASGGKNASEPARHQPISAQLTTAAQLEASLKSHGIWHWMSDGLKVGVQAL